MHADPFSYVDIDKYYHGTDVKFVEQGDKVFRIDAVTSQYISAFHVNKQGKAEHILVDISEGYDLSYTIPRKACFQHDMSAYMIYRIPMKQWKKGACSNNCGFSVLGPTSWLALTYTDRLLQAYCSKNEYANVHNLNPAFKSYALNHRLAMTKAGRLFLDSKHIGFFEEGRLKVHPLLVEYISKILPVTEHEDFYASA